MTASNLRLTGLLVMLCALPAPPLAGAVPPPDVTVAVDRQSGTVGDPFTLKLRVAYDSSLHLSLGFPGRSVGAFDVLNDSVAVDDPGLYERVWRLALFQTGTFWIPSLSGEVADSTGATASWHSDSLPVEVTSVLKPGEADSADIKSLKEAYAADEPISVWWYVIPAIAVAAVVAVWLVRRRRKPAEVVLPPPIPPWESALDALQSMRTSIDPSSDGGRDWYFRLSEILRRYVDGRYGWQSIDQTTTEILRLLNRAPFNGTHRDRFREFLREADLVRYARSAAGNGRPEGDWDWVHAFVRATTPRRPVGEDSAAETETEAGVAGGVG